MKVRDVMEPNIVTVRKDATYEEAARVLSVHGFSGVPVVDEQGALAGLVSEKDMFRVLYPFYKSYYGAPEAYADFEERENKISETRNKKVEIFMSRNVVTIDPEAPIMKAGAVMLAKGIHHLPVVENGKLVGIITRSRIYRTIIRQRLGW